MMPKYVFSKEDDGEWVQMGRADKILDIEGMTEADAIIVLERLAGARGEGAVKFEIREVN